MAIFSGVLDSQEAPLPHAHGSQHPVTHLLKTVESPGHFDLRGSGSVPCHLEGEEGDRIKVLPGGFTRIAPVKK